MATLWPFIVCYYIVDDDQFSGREEARELGRQCSLYIIIRNPNFVETHLIFSSSDSIARPNKHRLVRRFLYLPTSPHRQDKPLIDLLSHSILPFPNSCSTQGLHSMLSFTESPQARQHLVSISSQASYLSLLSKSHSRFGRNILCFWRRDLSIGLLTVAALCGKYVSLGHLIRELCKS